MNISFNSAAFFTLFSESKYMYTVTMKCSVGFQTISMLLFSSDKTLYIYRCILVVLQVDFP